MDNWLQTLQAVGGSASALGNAAGSAYTAITGANKPGTAQTAIAGAPAATTAAAQAGWKQYLPWILGGVGVVVLGLGAMFLFGRKKTA